jgi:hypothetical protein
VTGAREEQRDREERIATLIEAALDGTLVGAERGRLEALLASDPDARREIARQIRLARTLGGLLTEPSDAAVWQRVGAQLEGEPARERRFVAAVDARLDRLRPATRRRWLFAGLGFSAAMALLAVLVGRHSPRDPSGSASEVELVRAVAPGPGLTTAPSEELSSRGAPAGPPSERWEETNEILFALDAQAFRAGRLPRLSVRYGRPARCPPGVGVSTCFAAVRQTDGYPNQGSLSVSAREGLFPFSDDALLTFDYWLGEPLGPRGARITSWFDLEGGAGFEYRQGVAAVRGRWGHAVFPLAEYDQQKDDEGPEPGRFVRGFNLSCRVLNEDVFFVANLKVVRGRRR